MMVTGVILLISGYFIFANTNNTPVPETEIEGLIQAVIADGVFSSKERTLIEQAAEKHKLNKDDIIADVETRLATIEDDPETEVIDVNKKKGDDFEKFIVKKFDLKYFTIKQWAGDKYVEGVYSEKTLQPDIIVEYNHKKVSKQLAIECKYRERFNKGVIKLSYPDQLKRYKQFQEESGINVYIALGVGGKASNPDELFLIPLSELNDPNVTQAVVANYSKNVENNFFYKNRSQALDLTEYKIEKE